MPQSTAVLLMEQYAAALPDAEALALHIARQNWDTTEQVQLISELRVPYERLAEELRTAITAFRWVTTRFGTHRVLVNIQSSVLPTIRSLRSQ